MGWLTSIRTAIDYVAAWLPGGESIVNAVCTYSYRSAIDVWDREMRSAWLSSPLLISGCESRKFAKQCKRFRNNLKNSLDSGGFLTIIYTYFYVLLNDSYTEDENVLKANTPEERQQAVTATIDLCIGKGCLVR